MSYKQKATTHKIWMIEILLKNSHPNSAIHQNNKYFNNRRVAEKTAQLQPNHKVQPELSHLVDSLN